jgi:hypothetical protein
MEDTQDNGLDWRLEYKERLEALGVKCIIPQFEEEEFVPDWREFAELKKKDYQRYKKIMRKIGVLDVNFVHSVDLVITRWEGEVMSGTIGEAHENFFHAHKPNFLVTSQPLHTIPSWFGMCFDHEFKTLDDLVAYLREHVL